MERFQETWYEEFLKGSLYTKRWLWDHFMIVNERNETWFNQLKHILEAIQAQLEDKGKQGTPTSEHAEETLMEETSTMQVSGGGIHE